MKPTCWTGRGATRRERPPQHRRPLTGRRTCFLALLFGAVFAPARAGEPWTSADRLAEARIRLARGDEAGARLLVDEAIAREGHEALPARCLRGAILQVSGDPAAAEDLTACLDGARAPGEVAEARYRLARFALDRGAPEEARAHLAALPRRVLDRAGSAQVRLLHARVVLALHPARHSGHLARLAGARRSEAAPQGDRADAWLDALTRDLARAGADPRPTPALLAAEHVLTDLVATGEPRALVAGLHATANAWRNVLPAKHDARALRLDDLAVQVALRTGTPSEAARGAQEALDAALATSPSDRD